MTAVASAAVASFGVVIDPPAPLSPTETLGRCCAMLVVEIVDHELVGRSLLSVWIAGVFICFAFFTMQMAPHLWGRDIEQASARHVSLSDFVPRAKQFNAPIRAEVMTDMPLVFLSNIQSI